MLGRRTSNALRCCDFLRRSVSVFPAFWRNLPAFTTLAGRDGLASDCQHSHLVAAFSLSCRLWPKSAEKSQKTATNRWRFCLKNAQRYRPRQRKGHFSRFFSTGPFWGSHLPSTALRLLEIQVRERLKQATGRRSMLPWLSSQLSRRLLPRSEAY